MLLINQESDSQLPIFGLSQAGHNRTITALGQEGVVQVDCHFKLLRVYLDIEGFNLLVINEIVGLFCFREELDDKSNKVFGGLVDNEVFKINGFSFRDKLLIHLQIVQNLAKLTKFSSASLCFHYLIELSHSLIFPQLFLTLSFFASLNSLFSLAEFFEDFFGRGRGSCGPAVGSHLLHCVPISRVR